MILRGAKSPCRPGLNQPRPFQGRLVRLFLVKFAIAWSCALAVPYDLKNPLKRGSLFFVDWLQAAAAVPFARRQFAHAKYGHIHVALIDLKNWQVAGLNDIIARFDGVG